MPTPNPEPTERTDVSATSWNDDYETGHPSVDAEHRELMRQLEELKVAVDSGAGREHVTDLLVILQRYAHGHFAREEAHMVRVKCPAHGANCAAHKEFSDRLDCWLELLTHGATPLSLVRDVQSESMSWIRRHILKIDCQLRHCAPH